MDNSFDPVDHIEKRDKALFDQIAFKYAKKDLAKSTMIARRYQLLYAVDPVFDKIKSAGTIIEIACGVGASAGYLRGRYKNYLGVDHSEKMIEAARSFNRDIPEAEFVAGNIKMVDLGDRRADLVLAVGALHHMTNLGSVLQSLIRIAKPGGYFVAIEPQSGNPVVQFLRFMRKKIDRGYSEDQRYFTGKDLRNILSGNGMGDIEITHQGYFSPPFAQVILKPQIISVPLSLLAIGLDKIIDGCLPRMFKTISWNLVVRARFLDPA